MLKREVITTEDGSSSIAVPELDENYHSTHGALQESRHIFIGAGLNFLSKETVRIFEMGFGTGLNAILTYHHSEDKKIDYTTIEAYPVEYEMVKQLNYPEILMLDEKGAEVFYELHTILPDTKCVISKKFSFQKHFIKLSEFETDKKFDLIYFDAFAPEKQPKLWTLDVFKKMYNMLDKGGVLVTYCSKGQVRRNMIEAGFSAERLPGPPGKREILRAVKA